LIVTIWYFNTRAGSFVIEECAGRFNVRLGDEELGSYHSAETAADMLFSGQGVEPTCGNTGWLGIPRDLSRWHAEPLENRN
jgi:hypothetical protein